MPRMARIVIPDLPHHVTQRGNRREDVFFSDEDRRRYLLLLLEYSQKHALQIWAYCLM
ncbi:MAG: transposase, partial [Planctomycetes bacterium]|nr:transposase [Planctomycetota bacterium]